MLIINESDSNSIDIACDYLRAGKIIAFATDTIYGIAADASNSEAINKIYQIKERSSEKPIAIFVKNLDVAKEIFVFDQSSEKIAEKFLPGNLTMVLKTNPSDKTSLADNLNLKNDGFLGFRIIDRKFIQNLLQRFDGILAVSSANISKKKPATSANDVKEYFSKSPLDLLVDGGNSMNISPSTVIRIYKNNLEILRHGVILESNLLNL